jgi:hypothetical protein
VAVEPRTYGLLAVSDSTLYYVDRREPMPSRLDVTGLTKEPLYSLNVVFDEARPGRTRYVSLQPLAHSGADSVRLWRYLLQCPDGQIFAITPDGAFVPYSGGAGWRSGVPAEVSVPVTNAGTYVFTIECLDNSNQPVVDNFPYPNLQLNPAKSFDLSDLVPEARGIAYDSRDRLWIWTGDLAVPVALRYDGYVLESDTRTLYLTDQYEKVKILDARP